MREMENIKAAERAANKEKEAEAAAVEPTPEQ